MAPVPEDSETPNTLTPTALIPGDKRPSHYDLSRVNTMAVPNVDGHSNAGLTEAVSKKLVASGNSPTLVS